MSRAKWTARAFDLSRSGLLPTGYEVRILRQEWEVINRPKRVEARARRYQEQINREAQVSSLFSKLFKRG